MENNVRPSYMQPEEIIKAENLKKYYTVGGSGFFAPKSKTLHALDGVDITIHKGEIFGVVGESGCGKSTLGRCLLRLVAPSAGKITFCGEDITAYSRAQMKDKRKEMQMIFQNPFSSFNPKMRIGQSLYEVGGVHNLNKQQTGEKIEELLEYISLPKDVLNRMPSELSGGQLQRLAIARALLLSPNFIVADEPVSALDVSVQAQILNLIMDLRKKFQMTMLFISHEMTVVEHICDTVAVMYLGQVLETAPTDELFANILHPYTISLMSAIPKA
ncbi:MAG: ATP-binding cassette domain-containing protein, partial [Oscillospiraceae bacterium]